MKIKPYSPETESRMRNFYDSLSEKDRRRYAAVEATKLGYGGITYICGVLHCDMDRVRRGIEELKQPPPEQEKRIRKPGGGRKSVLSAAKGLEEAFFDVLKNHTAGSPADEEIKWTDLKRGEIAERLKEYGFSVSVTAVDQLLEKHNFRPRQAFKAEAGKKNIPNRDEQFENIERLKEEYRAAGNPVMSMDVKKKN
ncbi:MAG: hypothetical protein D3906_11290 [Candidatus Electrothrix sp. AUS1_2]|nr:hypothetical protein [Candidatus Electrothrix sp. AUS1_2]